MDIDFGFKRSQLNNNLLVSSCFFVGLFFEKAELWSKTFFHFLGGKFRVDFWNKKKHAKAKAFS